MGTVPVGKARSVLSTMMMDSLWPINAHTPCHELHKSWTAFSSSAFKVLPDLRVSNYRC